MPLQIKSRQQILIERFKNEQKKEYEQLSSCQLIGYLVDLQTSINNIVRLSESPIGNTIIDTFLYTWLRYYYDQFIKSCFVLGVSPDEALQSEGYNINVLQLEEQCNEVLPLYTLSEDLFKVCSITDLITVILKLDKSTIDSLSFYEVFKNLFQIKEAIAFLNKHQYDERLATQMILSNYTFLYKDSCDVLNINAASSLLQAFKILNVNPDYSNCNTLKNDLRKFNFSKKQKITLNEFAEKQITKGVNYSTITVKEVIL